MASKAKQAPKGQTDSKSDPKVAFDVSEHIKPQYQALKQRPEIVEAVRIFNEYKREIPPRPLPAKMKDHKLDGKFKKYRECHLSDDILLLYTQENRRVKMLYICEHDDLYGGKAEALAKTLKKLS